MRRWAMVVVVSVVSACRPMPGELSTVMVDRSFAIADGVDAIRVTVTAIGPTGQPVSGVATTLAVSGEAVTITPPEAMTDETGAATFQLRASAPGDKRITASFDKKTVSSSPAVTFTLAPATLRVTRTSPAVPVFAGDLVPLTVEVRDALDALVPGIALRVTCAPDAKVMPTSGRSDVTGAFATSCRSTGAGQKVVTASTADLSAQLTFNVRALPVDPGSTVVVSPNALASDGRDTGTITVSLRDTFGNPVIIGLVSVTTSGQASVFPPSRATDLEGNATFDLRSNTPGVVTVHASTRAGPLLAAPTVTFTQPDYHLVAYVRGLTGGDLVLSSPGRTDLTIPVDTERGEFSTPLTPGQPYGVSVKTQPPGQVCRVFGSSDVAQASNAFVSVACGAKWKAVADDVLDSFAIRDDGTLWTWPNQTRPPFVPTLLDSSTDWTSVVAIGGGFAALRADRTLWASQGATVLQQLGTDTDWTSLASGFELVAQKADGSLWWLDRFGANGSPATGWLLNPPTRVGTAVDRWTSFSIGTTGYWSPLAAAIRSDGTLWLWDHLNPTPVELGTDSDWAAVSGGYQHLLALKRDGSAWLVRVPSLPTSTVPERIGASSDWSTLIADRATLSRIDNLELMQKMDGTLWAFNRAMPLAPPTLWSSETDWAVVDQNSALKVDGSRWWGWRTNRLPYGTTPRDPAVTPSNQRFVAIAAAQNHSSAIAVDGTLLSWGDGTFSPVPASPVGARARVAATAHAQSAISSNGTLMTSGSSFNDLTVAAPGVWLDAAMGETAYALRNDATLWSLGSGTEVIVGTRWKALTTDSGGNFTALSEDGSMWTWTDIGNPPATAPSRTTPYTDWVSLVGYAGGVRANGTFWAYAQQLGSEADWVTGGAGGFYLPRFPFSPTSLSTVPATFGIKRDGSLWQWVSDNRSSTPPGHWRRVGTATGWTAVAPGESHTLGLRSDGSLWSWGDDTSGQLGDGSPNAFRFEP